MQCPDCKRYRHDGPCEPYMSDMEEYEHDYQEMARAFYELEGERLGRAAATRLEERKTP